MPKKTVLVDYHACDPHRCENDICKAALVCDRNVLTQKAPYEMPDAKASMCLRCSLCALECPKGAIYGTVKE